MTIEELELLAELESAPRHVTADEVTDALIRLEAAEYVTRLVVGAGVEFKLTDLGRFALRLREQP